jgi:hypothetical protein
MNDEIKQRLLGYLETLEAGVKESGEFLVEQTPLFVQELIAWHFWSYMLYALIWFICSFVAYRIGAMIYAISSEERAKTARERSGGEDECVIATTIFCTVFRLVALALAIVAIYRVTYAIQAKVAPRVVIVESLRNTVSSFK